MTRSPLTETFYRVQGMITYAQENLSTDEFMLFLDLLVPEPEVEPEPEVVKPAKKRRRSRGKSARAASLAEQINTTSKARVATGTACAHEGFNGEIAVTCAELEDNPIHDSTMGYAGYHEFQPAQRAAAAGAGIQSADTGPLP